MRFDVISLFPELVAQVGAHGVTGRAVTRALLHIHTWNPRAQADNRRASIDERPYGGGPGMVMQAGPLNRTLALIRQQRGDSAPVIALTPQGERFDHHWAVQLADGDGAILVSGRYEGIDQRFLAASADCELSLGDFVLSGGELVAMTVIDAVARLLPGALGDADSANQDSFAAGLLDHPHYTRPQFEAGRAVPSLLLSGNHAAIARWRLKQALGQTWLRRPDLLDGMTLSQEQRRLLAEFVAQGEW